jgi:hypothetical protein
MDAQPDAAGFLPMSTETRGHAIKQRRETLGIFSGYDFERASERVGILVRRALLSKAESGVASEASYIKIETALDRLEAGWGQDASPAEENEADEGPRTMEVRVRDADGTELVIVSPVSDAPELEGMVTRLIRAMRDPNA